MFDVGFWELIILFTLALLVLGPERLPRVTNSIGRWVGRARAMASNLKDQIEDEIELKELEKLHGMDKEFDLNLFDESEEKHTDDAEPESDDNAEPESDDSTEQENTATTTEASSKVHDEA